MNRGRALILLLGFAAGCQRSSGDDLCTGAASCDRQTLDGDEIVTASTATGYRTLIEVSAGTAEVVWTVAGGSTMFQYAPPDGTLGPTITIEGTPADAEGVSRAAILLHRTAGDTSALKPSYTGANTVGNTSGCDQTHGFDCGPVGKCCDIHDECITVNCGGQGGCGNVLHAFEAAYAGAPCSDACLRCHGDVVKCFFGGSKPGKSNCCDEGDCGQSQECMIAGKVITDPCDCKAQGIASASGCAECDPSCVKNFDGCLPDGTRSNDSTCCCSCEVRLSDPVVCSCQKDCCLNFSGCEPAGTNVNHYSACCSCKVNGPALNGTCL